MLKRQLIFLGHIMRNEGLENSTPTRHIRARERERKVTSHLPDEFV